MSEGIEQVKMVVDSAVSMVNAEQKLAGVDLKGVYKQFLDLDDAEAQSLLESVLKLDLSNDKTEADAKAAAAAIVQYLPFIMRLLKLVLPKPQ